MAPRTLFKYTMEFMRSLKNSSSRTNPQVKTVLRDFGILRGASRPRGKKAGRHFIRNIGTVIGRGSELINSGRDGLLPTGISRANLTVIKPVNNISPNSITPVPTFLLTNARSLLNKLDEFQGVLSNNDVDIAAVSETWFTPTTPEQTIDGYTVYTKSRTSRRGGGVALYVRENIPSRIISEISVPEPLECLWVNVRPHKLSRQFSSIAICTVYSPPQSPHEDQLVEHLITASDQLRTKYPNIGLTFVGDFNHAKIQDILLDRDFSQVVNNNTRGNAILDLIITNMRACYKKPEILPPLSLCDHNCVLWKPQVRLKQNTCAKKTTRPIREPGLSDFGRWITTYTWEEVFNATTATDKAKAFYGTLTHAIDRFFPVKTVKLHPNDKPWVTPLVKFLIRKRQEAFSSELKAKYKYYNTKVQKEIRKAKSNFYKVRVEGRKKENPRTWHKNIKDMCNMSRKTTLINTPNIDQNDFTAIANEINRKFAEVSQSLPPLDPSSLPAFLPDFSLPTIEVWEVYAHLRSTNPHKSPGPDGLPGVILKEFACEISGPLCDLINTSIKQGIVPHQWKEANVTPLPKCSPPHIDELRPISLTSLLAKVCERFVANWILEDISPHLDPRQFGCRRKRSTTHALVSLLDFMYKSTSTPSSTCTLVTTDLSKAFDRVDHATAIKCLLNLGVRPALIPWVCSFMANRRQRVNYMGKSSDWTHLTCGVAQGTILGPIIFMAVIDGASRDVHDRWKYVDDLNLAQKWSTRQPCTLQPTLDDLNHWVGVHKMKLNPRKCKVLHVCYAKLPPIPLPLTLEGQELESVVSIKVVGVTIQNDLRWNTHVSNMITGANRKLYPLRRLKRFGMSVTDLTTVFTAYVRPSLEYATPVWHSSLTVKQTTSLERIQKRACRIILGHQYDNYASALESLNLTTLSDRRVSLCRSFATSLLNSEFRNWLPPTRRDVSGRQTRNSHKIDTPYCRTERYKNSPLPYLIELLNNES
ncbi:hypothetical protein Bbelb_365600 [Branchiostoma belcheri]|nr:hypothetical protein Bbelb_365600 [Branchiostoma belcheri]